MTQTLVCQTTASTNTATLSFPNVPRNGTRPDWRGGPGGAAVSSNTVLSQRL